MKELASRLGVGEYAGGGAWVLVMDLGKQSRREGVKIPVVGV